MRHVNIWDFPVEVRIYNPQLKKLDPRTVSGYFIGYPTNSKGYKFYYPSHTLRIIEARNEKFIEDLELSGNEFPRNIAF